MSDTQNELVEIRAERKRLEKLQLDLQQPRRGALCGAKTAAGGNCKRSPIPGGSRCVLHGGASPLARQEAERRLLLGVSFALDRLLDAVSEHHHAVPCPMCGCNPSRNDPNVLRAAVALLDRSGFGPGVTLSHTNEEHDIREIRVNIVEPDPSQLAEYEASDRAALAARTAKYNQELEEQEPEPGDDRHTVSIDLETDR